MIVWLVVLVVILLLVLGILLYFFFKDRKVITGGIIDSIDNNNLNNVLDKLNSKKIASSIIKNIIGIDLRNIKISNESSSNDIAYINSIYVMIFLKIIDNYEPPEYVPIDITKIIV